MQKRNKCRFLSICMCCILLLCMPVTVSAEIKGSVTLKAVVDKDGNKYKLKDTEFILYQVGIYSEGSWKLQSDFEGSGVTFDLEDSSMQGTDALKLEKYAKRNEVAEITETTDQNGEVFFGNLEQGIYLIVQPEKTYLGSQAYQSEPFLVAVPGNYANQILWNIMTEPKFKNESIPTIVTKTPPISETPSEDTVSTEKSYAKKVKTGDETEICGWILLMGISIAGIGAYKRKQKS